MYQTPFLSKIIGGLLKKQTHMLQISLREMHNNIILPVYKGGFHDSRIEDGGVFIGDNSRRK